jgi:ABC-type multidrug transport system fused ATPase/permease subunit
MEINSTELVAFREMLGPWFGSLIERLSGLSAVSPRELLTSLPLILITLAFAKAVLAFLQWHLWESLSEKVAKKLRFDLIQGFSWISFKSRYKKEVVELEENLGAALANDTRMFRDFIVHFYGAGPREAFQVLAGLASLYLLSPYLFLVCFIGIAPSVLILRQLGKKIHKRSGQALGEFSELGEFILDRLLGLETIKHYKTEAFEGNTVRLKVASLLSSFKRVARVKARTSPMLEAIAVLAMVVLLILGFKAIEEGEISGSIFVSFFGSLALLSQSFSKVGKYYNINRESYAAIDRIKKWIDLAKENQDPGKIALQVQRSDQVALTLEKVTFSYEPSAKNVLNEVTYRFEPGKIYALAGVSGAGKSTCLKLLLGLFKPSSGQVYYSGNQTPRIGYMPQRVALYAGSIAENLAWPLNRVDDVVLDNALQVVSLKNLVSQLEGGLHYIFDYGSKKLSGGQIQRLLLGRLFCQPFDIILIDEGTSALDPDSERVIIEGIRKLATPETIVVMIAHRKSMLSFADQILFFKESRLGHVGTFQELSGQILTEPLEPKE